MTMAPTIDMNLKSRGVNVSLHGFDLPFARNSGFCHDRSHEAEISKMVY
jgi:hypothetical protein